MLSYGLKPFGLYRHRRGLGLDKVGYNGRRPEHLYLQACLPRQGKSLPDTGRSLQSCIFIVQESGGRYSSAIRTPPNPGLPQLPWKSRTRSLHHHHLLVHHQKRIDIGYGHSPWLPPSLGEVPRYHIIPTIFCLYLF